MNNGNGQGNGRGRGNCSGQRRQNGCAQGIDKQQGCQGQGRNKNCQGKNGSQGKGKRREMFEQKYSEYLKTVELPEFDTQEKYAEWLKTTEEGKSHASAIDKINAEIDVEFPWGGRRENAGRRKECIKKIPYSRRINSDVLDVLKTYAQEQNITETQALEKAILNLK